MLRGTHAQKDFGLWVWPAAPEQTGNMAAINGPVALTLEECWDLLRTIHVARVAYSERALPAITSVPVEVLGDRILIMVGDRSPEYAALRGAVVALQADQREHDKGTSWSVNCVGMPHAYRLRASYASEFASVLALEPELLQGRMLNSLPVLACVLATTATAPGR